MDYITLRAGLNFTWDIETDVAKVILNEDETEMADDEVAEAIFLTIGRKCKIGEWDAVNEGKGAEALASVEWLELTPTQRYEILRLAEPTALAFVNEFNEPLDSAATDWDATAWEEDNSNLSFWEEASHELAAQAWELYSEQLERVTAIMCAGQNA